MLNLFAQACVSFGVPSRVRCDRGGENIDVALFMSLVRKEDHHSVIAGRSVHNQRIERLWRDVATQVTEVFYKQFYELEDEGQLDVSNEQHLTALQLAALPVINASMSEFSSGWNNHRLSTAANHTPKQLWLSGMLDHMNSGHVATEEVFSELPSLAVRIENALQHFSLTIDHFTIHDTPTSPSRHHVSSVDAASVQAAIAGQTDIKAMYRMALHTLQQLPPANDASV